VPARIYYCDVHAIDLPTGHRFPSGKYKLVRDLLACDGFTLQLAPFAPVDLIKLVHSERYVGDFLSGSLSPSAVRRIGFPWSDGLVRRTLTSLGGTLAAADDALKQGWGANLAGGTHHAFC
jgi:acetoin utilization deacetylase AcuC-like enzyme